MQTSLRTPEKRRRVNREAMEQETVFEWRDLVVSQYPGVHLMFAIPNGAYLQGDSRRRAMQWAKLKKQGAKEGVHDIFLPVARGGYFGLWVEMKAPKPYSAKVSDEQKEWKREMQEQGYCAVVCYGADQAIEAIKAYYGGE